MNEIPKNITWVLLIQEILHFFIDKMNNITNNPKMFTEKDKTLNDWDSQKHNMSITNPNTERTYNWSRNRDILCWEYEITKIAKGVPEIP